MLGGVGGAVSDGRSYPEWRFIFYISGLGVIGYKLFPLEPALDKIFSHCFVIAMGQDRY